MISGRVILNVFWKSLQKNKIDTPESVEKKLIISHLVYFGHPICIVLLKHQEKPEWLVYIKEVYFYGEKIPSKG